MIAVLLRRITRDRLRFIADADMVVILDLGGVEFLHRRLKGRHALVVMVLLDLLVSDHRFHPVSVGQRALDIEQVHFDSVPVPRQLVDEMVDHPVCALGTVDRHQQRHHFVTPR
ncbi:hypothetical protein D3C83_22300 [compost metagenome]